MERITAVVFDWAGTTVDYGCFAPVRAFDTIFREKGIELSIDEIRKPMGIKKKDHIRELCNLERIKKLWVASEDDIDILYKSFETTLLKSLSEFATPIPGVIDVVNYLGDNGIKIGSTTGYTKSMIDIVASEAAKKGYKPDSIVNSSDVPLSRPAPFMCYQNAINLQSYPLHCMVKVGDTIADIKEGINAGMWCVNIILGSSMLGMAEDQTPDDVQMSDVRRQFKEAGAHYVINSIKDLPDVINNINRALKAGDCPIFPRNEYKLLTPGPITTTRTVKLSMMTDLGSRSDKYKQIVKDVRERLLKLANANPSVYTTVLLQGSGTFAVESVFWSVPGKLLIISNGAYGRRMCSMIDRMGVRYDKIVCDELNTPNIEEIEHNLKNNYSVTYVAVVHSETTTGIVNPLSEIAKVVKSCGKKLIVDAMSSFGAIHIDISDIDFLVSSPNKNIQGVPGFAYVIAKKSELIKCEGISKSLSLDLYDQWAYMEKNPNSFRFTSPVHVIQAFHQALIELEQEGVDNRYQRYTNNQKILSVGMKKLGFETVIMEHIQGPIVTTFHSPKMYDFRRFYEELESKGFVIYPGKTTNIDTFRIGTIGDLYPEDIHELLSVIKK